MPAPDTNPQGARPRTRERTLDRRATKSKGDSMKRIAFLLGLAAVTWVVVTTATAGNQATPRSVCHRTSSSKTPYVKISVSAQSLRTHTRHAADIIPAPAGRCPQSLLTAAAGGRAFTIAMVGEAESPAGDPVGTGTATIRMRAGQ